MKISGTDKPPKGLPAVSSDVSLTVCESCSQVIGNVDGIKKASSRPVEDYGPIDENLGSVFMEHCADGIAIVDLESADVI